MRDCSVRHLFCIVLLALLSIAVVRGGELAPKPPEAENPKQEEHDLINRIKMLKTSYWGKMKEEVSKNEKEISKLLEGLSLKQFAAAVKTRDLEELKAACNRIDKALEVKALHHYYRAFELEIEEGSDAARKYVEKMAMSEDVKGVEKGMLTSFSKHYKTAESICTWDNAVLILLLALECKFPHGRGTVPAILLLDALGLYPESKAADGKGVEPAELEGDMSKKVPAEIIANESDKTDRPPNK